MRTLSLFPTSKIRLFGLVSIALISNAVFGQKTPIIPNRAQLLVSSFESSEVVVQLMSAEANSKDVATFFNVKPNKVSKAASKTKIQTLEIAISNKKLLQKPLVTKNKIVNPYCQIMYAVEKGETLFSIAKKSGKSIDEIQFLNDMKADEIKVGQKLLIGYVQIYPTQDAKAVTKKMTKEVEKPVLVNKNVAVTKPTKSDPIDNHALTQKKEIKTTPKEKLTIAPTKETEKEETTPVVVEEAPKVVTKNGIAMWDKHAPAGTQFYVLHNEAKIGSTIQVYFPMLKRKAKAKVLGRIPAGTYTNDVTLFVSPAVANELGILDNKANVVVSYLQGKAE